MNSLQIVNKVLLELGERRVTAVDENSASSKVYGMLQEVVDAVNFEHPWEELYKETTLDNLDAHTFLYTTDVALLLPEKTVHLDKIVNIVTGVTLTFYDKRRYKDFQQARWTKRGNKLIVSIDPEDSLEDYCLLHYSSFTVPSDEGEAFPVSSYLTALYSKRLLLQFSARHVNNMQLVDAVFAEYKAALAVYNVTTTLVLGSSRDSHPHSFGEPDVPNTSVQRAAN